MYIFSYTAATGWIGTNMDQESLSHYSTAVRGPRTSLLLSTQVPDKSLTIIHAIVPLWIQTHSDKRSKQVKI